MQTLQKQPQIKTNQPTNIKIFQKQAQTSEKRSQYNLQSKKDKTHIRKNKNVQRKKYTRSKINKLHWTLEENILYKQFLEQNINLLKADFHHRLTGKIHVLMSECIKTKNFKQCRSHHQKMMVNHQNLTAIIKFIENLQKKYFTLEIKPRSQERHQSCKENSSAQQINENMMKDGSNEMIQIQPKIQWPQQIISLPLKDISQIEIELNTLSFDSDNISHYFQPNVWWDGCDI